MEDVKQEIFDQTNEEEDEYEEEEEDEDENGITISLVSTRGNFSKCTMEVAVELCDGTLTTAMVPPGENQTDETWIDYWSNVVFYIKHVIHPVLLGMDPTDQVDVDEALFRCLKRKFEDEDLNKNAGKVTFAVSAAVCKAGALVKGESLFLHISNLACALDAHFLPDSVVPVPVFNLTFGGSHSRNKQKQHFVFIPKGFRTLDEAIEMSKRLYCGHLEVNHGEDAIDVGGEGVYTPNIKEIKKGLNLLRSTIASFDCTDKVFIGLDVGASIFYGSDETYRLNFKEENNEDSLKIFGDALKDVYKSLVEEYSIALIQDAFHPNDSKHSAELNDMYDGRVLVVIEDDQLLINPVRLEREMKNNIGNALLLKMDQMRTVTKCIDLVLRCNLYGWGVVMSSHASCDTQDTFIADICRGLSMVMIYYLTINTIIAFVQKRINMGAHCLTNSCTVLNRLSQIDNEQLGKFRQGLSRKADRKYDLRCTGSVEDCSDEETEEVVRKIQKGELTRESFKEYYLSTFRWTGI